jgi:hypothetical protein
MFVDVLGHRTSTVSEADVQRLIQKVIELDYSMIAVPTVDSPGVCQATDGPGYTTTVSLNRQQRTIVRCPRSTSEPIAELEDLIDEVAGTERWVGQP